MSSSLVRKSLELLESEVKKPNDLQKKDSRKQSLKSKKKFGSSKKRILGDAGSSAAREVERARRSVQSGRDRTIDNLKQLKILSSVKSVNIKAAKKVLDHTVKTRAPIDDTAPETDCGFTEEDFRKFEEEYFVS